MRKLSLSLADLQVHSFETGPAGNGAGTVHGAIVATDTPQCRQKTRDWSCGIVCAPTKDPQATGPCQCPDPTEAPAC